VTTARYDDHADYYDELVRQWGEGTFRTLLRKLLGLGTGRCLDVGCGTGFRTRLLSELGWQPVGVDISQAELRIASQQRRLRRLVCADAGRLPIRSSSLAASVSLTTHTDVDDWPGLLEEVARVLRPGGVFVYAGLHPCFVGPFAKVLDDGGRHLVDGYRETGLRFEAPAFRDGLRTRVGARHIPLAELLNSVIAAGFRLERLVEDDDQPLPGMLAFRAVLSRPGPGPGGGRS
jgi:SAM-dependent methyltransferase